MTVDPNDPAFSDPTKPIGPVYEEAEARQLAENTIGLLNLMVSISVVWFLAHNQQGL